jgi:ribosome production factor 1
VVLKGFTTRLGHRVARQLKSLFPAKCDETGRRVVAFHNQRDFLFFRHYRFAFKDIDVHPDDLDEEQLAKAGNRASARCALQEIGPRFTLKLHALQLGTFDKKNAQYEFIWRPDSQVDRKSFAM